MIRITPRMALCNRKSCMPETMITPDWIWSWAHMNNNKYYHNSNTSSVLLAYLLCSIQLTVLHQCDTLMNIQIHSHQYLCLLLVEFFHRGLQQYCSWILTIYQPAVVWMHRQFDRELEEMVGCHWSWQHLTLSLYHHQWSLTGPSLHLDSARLHWQTLALAWHNLSVFRWLVSRCVAHLGRQTKMTRKRRLRQLQPAAAAPGWLLPVSAAGASTPATAGRCAGNNVDSQAAAVAAASEAALQISAAVLSDPANQQHTTIAGKNQCESSHSTESNYTFSILLQLFTHKTWILQTTTSLSMQTSWTDVKYTTHVHAEKIYKLHKIWLPAK